MTLEDAPFKGHVPMMIRCMSDVLSLYKISYYADVIVVGICS